jgi:hypothetical protein
MNSISNTGSIAALYGNTVCVYVCDWIFTWLGSRQYWFPKDPPLLATVGHSFKSTSTDRRRLTALCLTWRSPVQVLTEVDVPDLQWASQ